MLNQAEFREEIITEGNGKNIMGNMMLNLLKDVNGEYEENTLQDFLNERELFKKGKAEIYEILSVKDQKVLDIADRILWGNNKEEKDSEKTRNYQETYSKLKTDELFLGIKGHIEGDNSLKSGLIREVVKQELIKIDVFKKLDAENQFNSDFLNQLNPYDKAQFVFKMIQITLHEMGFPLLPEKIRRDRGDETDDRASANMNNLSIIAGMPFSEDWTRVLTKESMELLVRLDADVVRLFMYHFEINSPDKLNAATKKFVGSEWEKRLDEAGIRYEHSIRKDDNYLVEYLWDSFGRGKGLGIYLDTFKINTIEEFEKLFPYGVIHGRMCKRHSSLGLEKAFKVYGALGFETVDDLVNLFGDENFEKLKDTLGKAGFGRMMKMFEYLGFEESYLRMNFVKEKNFSHVLEKKFKKTKSIGDFICVETQEDRVKFLYHNNLKHILKLEQDGLEKIFSFMELKSVEEYRNFVYDDGFKDFATKYDKYGKSLSDETYDFDAGNSKKTYVNESLELLSLAEKDNIQEAEEGVDVSKENWMKSLIGYGASMNEEVYLRGNIGASYKKLFEELEAQNLVYEELHTIYLKLLKQEKINHKELAVLNALQAYGVGNLSYTSLLVNISNCVRSLDAHKGNKDIIGNIYENLRDVENVMKNWSLTDKTNLYGNITTATNIDATIASRCLLIVNSLSKKVAKTFSKEVLPILVSWLYLIKGEGGYDPAETNELIRYIDDVLKMSKAGDYTNEKQEYIRIEMLKSMKKWIQQRFHIKEMPLESLVENMGTIQNYLTYLANITKKNEEKTAILGLYLGLQLNNKWNDFRTGKEINYTEIFDENITWTLRSYFNTRKENDIFSPYSDKQKEIFQADTSTQTLGTVQTIDSKLSAINESLNDLLDEDNYETDDEINMLTILLKHGKAVGGTLALLYQGKETLFKEQHKLVKKDLEESYGSIELSSTIGLLQQTASEVSPSINFANKIKAMGISDKIEKLNTMKLPNAKLVKIFGKAGEKLSTSSGVIPIKNDIEYLRDILNTSKQINDKEREIGLSFLNEIAEYLQNLQKDFDRISNIYDNLAKTIMEGDNESLKGRIKDLNRIFDTSKEANEQSFLTTKLTSNFDIIIPNIRGCLGCMKMEINNDTNLTFGDSNKFFAAIFAEDQNRSIADCIVDVFPYTVGDSFDEENSKNTFVVERVYGERTPDILLSIVNVILKKKQESNIADVDILLSDEALTSCGLKKGQLEEFLQDEEYAIKEVNDANINVPQSPCGDGYYEFDKDGRGRFHGEVKASGLIISN